MHNPAALQINLVVALDTLTKISRGVYDNPKASAVSCLKVLDFYLDQNGRLAQKPRQSAQDILADVQNNQLA